MIEIKIKPLTVNEAWQGRRFKSKKYLKYEKDVLPLLPDTLEINPPYKIKFVFGFSNVLSDIDNPIKPFLDILQKKYNINDRDVYTLEVTKEIVKKGNEFIKFEIKMIE